ncbi:MAG: NUDIX domain-containing protein [bacterium]
MHAMMEIVLQILLLNDEGAVLMLQRPSGQWQFVGGRVNDDESWQQALRREIEEEVGVSSFEIDSIMALDNWVWEGVPQFGVFLAGRLGDQEIRLSEDHCAFRWLESAAELETSDFFHPSLQVLLARALRGELHYQPLDNP